MPVQLWEPPYLHRQVRLLRLIELSIVRATAQTRYPKLPPILDLILKVCSTLEEVDPEALKLGPRDVSMQIGETPRKC
jgi:hypothetical protein